MTDEEPESEQTAADSRLDVGDRLDDVAERAETAIDGLRESVGDPDAEMSDLPDLVDEADSESAIGYVEDLWEVADEIEDVVETIDLTDLNDIVDVGDVPEAVDASELPEAIAERDLGEAVKRRKLVKVINFTELWDAIDVRAFWKEFRELNDEVDDVTGADDDSLTPEMDVVDDVDLDRPDFEGLGDFDSLDDFDPESAENAIQKKILEGVDEFREALLASHEKLKALRDENRERTSRADDSTNSRSPTAVSTMPSRDCTNVGGTARFSTVPRETRHSTAPNRHRVYGDRFEAVTDDG